MNSQTLNNARVLETPVNNDKSEQARPLIFDTLDHQLHSRLFINKQGGAVEINGNVLPKIEFKDKDISTDSYNPREAVVAHNNGDSPTSSKGDVRTRALQELENMGLDKKTKEVVDDFLDAFKSKDKANLKDNLSDFMKEHGGDPELKKAIESVVTAFEHQGVKLPISVSKDGYLVFGDKSTGGVFFRKDGSSQHFEGRRDPLAGRIQSW